MHCRLYQVGDLMREEYATVHGRSPRSLRLLRLRAHRMPYVKGDEMKCRRSVREVENDMSLAEDAWRKSREVVQSKSVFQ